MAPAAHVLNGNSDRSTTASPPPAYAGGSDRDAIGRLPGQSLCPERFDEEALEKIRRKLGSYSFSALYQQRPTPAEGGIFKRAWFKKMIPYPPAGLNWKRGYDLAVSTKTTACFTASFRCAFDKDGNLYIDGGFSSRIEFPDQRRYIIDRIQSEPNTEHGIELALHGQAIMQDLRRTAGVRSHLFRGVQIETDKITRALPWAALAEEGRVILIRGPWNTDFLDEVCSFPHSTFDDQIDAVSIAVQMLKIRRYTSIGW
jgi:predicted phage terminase large subunit-like protein